MEVKSFIFFAIIIAIVVAVDDRNINYSKVIPRTEVPGFWIGRTIQPMTYERSIHHKYEGSSRIVGGEEAAPNAHPYQVGLFILIHWWTSFCGGNLISRNCILTAAHCVEESIGLTAVLGAHRVFDSLERTQLRIGFDRTSNNIIVHPEYNPSMLYNDLAFLVLPIEVAFNNYIQPIKLPDEYMRRKDFAGEIATVSGWGRTHDTSSAISEVLRFTRIEVKENSACYDIFGNFVIDSTLCVITRDTNSGTCNGDSGGPLTVIRKEENVLIGVVSFGALAGCQLGFPSGFARVTYFMPWIEENLKQHCGECD